MKPDINYSIPFRQRLDWHEVQNLIDQQRYFLIHAPRQTGKTSVMLALMEELNAAQDYAALYINVEGAQVARSNVASGIGTICDIVVSDARVYLQEERLRTWLRAEGLDINPEDRFRELLRYWTEISLKPTVLFIDEVDALLGDTLVSMLRQLRAGYGQRPQHFPQSVVLCGLRDIKDYRIHVSSGDVITGGSAFNIKAKSLRMDNFGQDEVRQLYQQHADATGQIFADEIFAELWQDTQGQPWLVNALAQEMTWEDKSARDRATPITLERYRAARERLIQSCATHLDQLTDKLKEPRVHAIISQLLVSESNQIQAQEDDMQYVVDLGLITRKPNPHISNKLYQEIIPRELTTITQDSIVEDSSWYIGDDNRLIVPKLLAAFQQFFRENSDSWIERFDYKEAGPQLLIQAFLQRILNGGGRINREYGLGRKRTDLSVEWPLTDDRFHGPVQRVVIELKIQRDSLEATLQSGLAQIQDYATHWGADEAHLVIFNRDPDISWDDKIWQADRQVAGWGSIGVWGC